MPARRSRRHLAVLTFVPMALAVLTPSASGAQYSVQLCHQGSGYATTGVGPTTRGSYLSANATCPAGDRSLHGAFFDGVEHAPGDHAYVGLNAPSGTTLTRLSARRVAAAGPSRPFGTPVARLVTDNGSTLEAFTALQEPSHANGTASYDLDGAAAVAWGVECTGTAGCPAGSSYFTLYDLTLDLADASIPTLSNVGGTLRSASTTVRERSLTFAATDGGGGVYRQRLVVDGVARPAQTVDANGGRCVTPFTATIPCRREVTGTVTLDTATLAEGTHEIALDVRDTTDDNRRVEGPWSILVDNLPPVVGAPILTGTAREGDTLTCAASVNGQTPTVTFAWLRTHPDGSAPVAIDGATNAAYTAGSADVGRKLICRVTAGDAGGTTVRETTITQSPFDAGRTVAPYCTDRPTGARDECGDLDGDGVTNRLDPDIDGDGIANESDTDPRNAEIPGAQTPVPAPGGTPASGQDGPSGGSGPAGSGGAGGAGGAAGAPGAPGAPGAAGASAPLGSAGTVRFALAPGATTGPAKRARWGRSAFVLRGRLTDPGGAAVSGIRLTLSQKVRSTTRELAAVTTASDGSWAFRVPRGPSRTITVRAGEGESPATVSVRQTVVAQVAFRSLKKRIPRGGAVSFRGSLRGGYTNGREKLVEFQVHYRGAWRTIATLHAKGGRFGVRYRFGRAARGTFRFRARTLPTDGYPFAPTTSTWRNAKVKVG